MNLPLTQSQKRKIVRQLVNAVRDDILAVIPKMPEEWDGIELREYIADSFAKQTHLSGRMYWGDMAGSRNADRKRLREYRSAKASLGL